MAAKRSRATELKGWLGVKQAHEILESEGQGLYDEIDKLCRKVPSETATTLQLTVVNGFIKRTKQLLTGDPIIDEVTLFIAAGDNPEYRDIITVLRQLNQGLERFKEHKSKYLWDEDFEDELLEHELDSDDATPFFD